MLAPNFSKMLSAYLQVNKCHKLKMSSASTQFFTTRLFSIKCQATYFLHHHLHSKRHKANKIHLWIKASLLVLGHISFSRMINRLQILEISPTRRLSLISAFKLILTFWMRISSAKTLETTERRAELSNSAERTLRVSPSLSRRALSSRKCLQYWLVKRTRLGQLTKNNKSDDHEKRATNHEKDQIKNRMQIKFRY